MNKKFRTNKKLDNAFIRLFLPLIAIGIIIYVIKAMWVIFVPIIVIALAIYIVLRIRRYKKLKSYGEFYTVRKHCPNCGRMNDFRYHMGSPATGVRIDCSKCGTSYS